MTLDVSKMEAFEEECDTPSSSNQTPEPSTIEDDDVELALDRRSFLTVLRQPVTYAVLTAIKPVPSYEQRNEKNRIFSSSFVVPEEMDALDAWVTKYNEQGFNIYFHVNDIDIPIEGMRKAKNDDINDEIRLMHVDIDLAQVEVERVGYAQAKLDLMDTWLPRLEASGCCAIMCTGNGLSAYWNHPRPVTKLVAKYYNVEAIKRYGGDKATADVSRIMRLPDTTNWADYKKLERGFDKSAPSYVIMLDKHAIGTPFFIDEEAVVASAKDSAGVGLLAQSTVIQHPSIIKKNRVRYRDGNTQYVIKRMHWYKRREGVNESDEDFRIICWLLWVCRGDVEQVNDLYCKDAFKRKDGKWEEVRGDTTYGELTIRKALEQITTQAEEEGRSPFRGEPVSSDDLMKEQYGLLMHQNAVRYIDKATGTVFGCDADLKRWEDSGYATDAAGNTIYKKNSKGEIDENKPWNKVDHWMMGNHIDKFRDVVLRPDKPPGSSVEGGKFNTFKGSLAYDVMNCEDGLTESTRFRHDSEALIHNHLLQVWCSGDEDSYQYLIKWLARMVQMPHKPAESIVVIQGTQGSGKSIVGEMCRGWFDKHTYMAASQEGITGRFVKPLYDAVLVVMEEAFNAHDHSTVGVLKSMVTAGKALVESKGKEKEVARSCVHAFLFTNNMDAVHLEGDDRRHFVRQTDVARGKQYYKELAFAMFGDDDEGDIDDLGEDAGRAKVGLGSLSFLHSLAREDISGFHPQKDMPNAKDEGSISLVRDNIVSSLGAVDSFIYDWIIDNEGELEGHAWDNGRFTKAEIKEAFYNYCNRTSQHRVARSKANVMGKRLKLITGGDNTQKITSVNGGRVNAWQFNSLEDTQNMVLRKLGVIKGG